MRRLLLSAASDTSGELPSRADIEQLRQQVDALTTLVEELLEREPERQAPQQG
jgi:hypothetical protein